MAQFVPDFSGGVSRREIALSPAIWRIVALTYAFFGVVSVALPLLFQTRAVGPGYALSGVLGAVALFAFVTRPPAPGERRLHVILASAYVVPAGFLYTLDPLSPLAFAPALYAGPLAAVWAVDRRHFAAHMVAAGIALSVPVAFGAGGPATLFGVICAIPSIWFLGAICMFVLEAAESQGARLDAAGRLDALTGLANRRALDEALGDGLRDAAEQGRPLAIVALDLNGFKALNDTAGHDAGDRLLVATADALRRCARPGDTVARQGGDEFCLVLPGTGAAQAEVVSALVRRELARIELYGQAVSTGVGIASFPADGATRDALLDVADARLRESKRSGPARGQAPQHGEALVTPDPLPREVEALPLVERRELASAPFIWRATAVAFVFYTLGGSAIAIVAPQLEVASVAYTTIVLATVIAVAILATPPQPSGSLGVHALLVCTYVMPALALASTRPAGSAVIATAIWIGPLVALRTSDRRTTFTHYLAATVVLAAAAPFVRPEAWPALAVMIGTAWVLGFCCVLVFEGTEAQGRRLRQLVHPDPLTGIANRRRLDELVEHDAPSRRAVLALDLNGFKALNDQVGHAAGDELLRRIAQGLVAVVGDQGEVIRQGGDEFVVVIPGAGPGRAVGLADRIREALGSMVVAGVRVTTGVGVATSPEDGDGLMELLRRADGRLLADKPAAGDPIASRRGQSAHADKPAESAGRNRGLKVVGE